MTDRPGWIAQQLSGDAQEIPSAITLPKHKADFLLCASMVNLTLRLPAYASRASSRVRSPGRLAWIRTAMFPGLC